MAVLSSRRTSGEAAKFAREAPENEWRSREKKLLPPQSPRGFSALARLYYLARPSKTAMLRRLRLSLLRDVSRNVPQRRWTRRNVCRSQATIWPPWRHVKTLYTERKKWQRGFEATPGVSNSKPSVLKAAHTNRLLWSLLLMYWNNRLLS